MRGADPPAAAGLPLLPRSRPSRTRRLRSRHPRRFHRQPPVQRARPARAVRRRAGRRRGGPPGPAHHQRRRVRPRVARAGHADGGRLRAGRGRVAAALPARGRPGRAGPAAPRRDRAGADLAPRAADGNAGEVRGPGRDHRHRELRDRPPPDGPAARADRAGVRARGRRRRSHHGRHRRPVDLSRRRPGRRVRRGRPHPARGRAEHPPDLVQRRLGDVRPRRLADRRDAGGGGRAGPARAVLPHGLGVHLRRAGWYRSARPRRHTRWRRTHSVTSTGTARAARRWAG